MPVYLPDMGPASGGHLHPGLRPAIGDCTREPEHFGPLEVRRYVKEDGRALILYSRVERDD
jgi:hypothetical protein